MQMPDAPTPHDATPPLEPELQRAERLLRRSLGEVCATDPTRADTAEMIRLDEMLAIAGDAAKRAVSIRRRLRQEGRPAGGRRPRRRDGAAESTGSGPAATVPASADGNGAAPASDGKAPRRSRSVARATERAALAATPADEAHRVFRDSQGVTWSVWAVRPSGQGGVRAELRGTFAQGWLAFVCEDEKRRLSPVPDEWATLDDSALEALCVQAEVARQEAPTRRGPTIRE